MAISKVILNEDTLMDVTQDTVATNNMLSGIQATAANGESIVGQIEAKSSSDLTVSGATVTAPAGYYAGNASKSVATTTHPKPTASINSSTGVVTASHTQSTGYVTGGTTTGTLSLSTQAAKTVEPTEEEQTAVSSGKYTTGAVKVGAISNTYVGTGIDRRESSDLTASGATVTVPAGYYAESASKSVATTTHPNPTATINSSTGVVTASHTQGTGYVTGGTTTGTLNLSTQAAKTVTPTESIQEAVAAGKYTTGAVTVGAIDSNYVGSGVTKRTSSNLTVSGATVTAPAGYYASAASKSVASGSAATPATTIVSQPTMELNIETGLVTATNTKTQDITPTVTAGYVSSGMAGTVTVSGGNTLQIATKAGETVTPSTASQTIATAGKYMTGNVVVNAIPSNYIEPTGSVTITSNTTTDVTNYASVVTDVHEGLVDMTWSKIKQCVNEGLDPSFLPIGTQITDKWTWQGTTYDAPWNVVHYNSNGMYLQWEYATPEAMQFDAPEAIYYVGENGLAAGTYYFSIGYTQSQWSTDKHIQFTLANDCDPGDQFVLSGISTSSDPTASRTITVYGKGSTIAKQTATTSNGTSGTELGTFGAGGTQNSLYYQGDGNQCNGIFWARYGNHRWSQSAIRQWLNSDAAAGEWWQPMNPWDRPPDYAATRPGFLSGYSEEFKSMLEPTAVVTALDTVSGFEHATETTYDKVFLSNAWQLYSSIGASLQDGEGESWDYWKQQAEDAGIQGMMNDTIEARNILKRYPINAQASANYVWLRSPIRTNSNVNVVYNSGSISNANANGTYRCCPACIIKKSTPSYLTPSNLDWTAIKKMATLGTDSSLEVGTQIVGSWNRSDTGAAIDVPWDVVHYDDKNMVLQWHYTLPFNMIFDEQEAMYYVGEEGLPAGTYYITTGSNTGVSAWDSKNIQFTLSSACDPGDQFVIASPTSDPTASRTLTVYGYGETTAKQTATTSSGTDGTLLGTMGDKGATNGNCNGVYWVTYGNHRWSQSNLRTWLNSDSAAGEWFTPMNPWDRPPSYVNYPGFLYGCSESFKNAIAVSENKTLLDTISGFTDVYETTYDRIYLPGVEELYTVPDVYGVEGEPWQYYVQQAKAEGYGGYLPQSEKAANALRIKYRYDAQTSADGVWLRSPKRASYGVRIVLSSGSISNAGVTSAYRCCPACKISLIK